MTINIFVTLDSNYIPYLKVMLLSVLISNPDTDFQVYIVHSGIKEELIESISTELHNKRVNIKSILITEETINKLPECKKYPKEMYYRIFAKDFLPKNIDKILYLDPDVVVINSLIELYSTDLKNYYFAAASHVNNFQQKLSEIRLKMNKENFYINSGIMLINLKLLREKQSNKEVYDYIEDNEKRLILPDQDVISALYGDKIKLLDSKIYNLSEKFLRAYNNNLSNIHDKINLKWIEQNSVIVHYCGKNKPWKEKYTGKLNCFYNKFSAVLKDTAEK